MSHYAVLVLHKEDQDIDTLLAPYDENLKVKPYLKFTLDETVAKAKEEYDNCTEQELIKNYAEDFGYILLNDGLYSTYNPNSKWERLELTEEGRIYTASKCEKEYNIDIDVDLQEDSDFMRYVNSAPIRYIKWFHYLTEEEKNKVRRWWEINIYDAPLKEGEEKDKYLFYNPKYYERRYRDAETDIKIQEIPTFFAIITSDGEWYSSCNMGWWACTDGEPEDELKWDLEFYDRFIKPNLDTDLICTVVDCHI